MADFTGREPEAQHLCAPPVEAGSTGRTSPVVVAVSGQPGVGKTALAVHVLYDVAVAALSTAVRECRELECRLHEARAREALLRALRAAGRAGEAA